MKKSSSLSINKIIVLLVFLSAAMMTSVFVFRMSHKAPQIYPLEHGSVFSVPRDIKSFELVSSDGNKFSEKNLRGHWTLLFFGFTHCAMICPTTLDMITRSYETLHASYPNLQVVFVSLDPERDSVERLATFTHDFHADFIGASGKIQNLRKLQSQLGIASERDLSSKEENYQLQHTSAILLINPEGKWAGFFNYGMRPEQFQNEFVEAVRLNS